MSSVVGAGTGARCGTLSLHMYISITQAGAGQLMQEFPEATFLVHPRGAAHMIDPSRLEASVRRVYGDETFDDTYGNLVPIDQDRVREMEDGEAISLGKRTLEFFDTPGHARHHFCVWDSETRGWFSGDTFGLSYRELDTENGPFIFPTTTPIEFDPEALKQSITILVQKDPECMYLTHFGRVGNIPGLADELISGVESIVQIAEKHVTSDERPQQIKKDLTDLLMNSARTHGITLDDVTLENLLMPDIDLNTQGIEVWLNRRERS